MVLRKAEDGERSSAGAYLGAGGLSTLVGVINLTKDDSAILIGIVLTIAGGALLLVGLIMLAIAESKKSGDG